MSRGPTAADSRDRGAAAVEFALLLPVLLLLVFGIIDFGRALNAQITLSEAAREGARLTALGQTNVVSRTQAAATGLSPVTVTVSSSCPAGAGPGVDAVVQVSYVFSFVTPVGALSVMLGGASYGSPVTLTATGEMACETLGVASPGARALAGCCSGS
jgi:Flp pilus assembly protein TadG